MSHESIQRLADLFYNYLKPISYFPGFAVFRQHLKPNSKNKYIFFVAENRIPFETRLRATDFIPAAEYHLKFFYPDELLDYVNSEIHFYIRDTHIPLLMEASKRKGGKKSVRRPRAGNSNNLVVRLNNLEKRFKNEVVHNPKWINTQVVSLSAGLTNAGPINLCMNAVAQGTTENTRIGAFLKMKLAKIHLSVRHTGTAQQATNLYYRVCVIVEKTCLGSLIALGSVFLDSPAVPMSQRDYQNRDARRYHILYDSGPQIVGCLQSALASPFASFANSATKFHNITCNLGNIVTSYQRGNAGTVADIELNSVSLCVFTDNGVGGILLVDGSYSVEFLDV